MVPPVMINWRAFATGSTDPASGAYVPYCAAVAPPAELALLAGLAHLVRGAATTPYASQGLTPDTTNAPAGYTWNYCHVFGPAVYAATGVFVVSTDGDEAKTPANVSSWSDGSGSAAADEVSIPSPIADGNYDSPPAAGRTTTVRASQTFVEAPTVAQDRLYEVAASLQSKVENFNGLHFNGCCLAVIQKGDLTAI